jgi:hypothetical protein
VYPPEFVRYAGKFAMIESGATAWFRDLGFRSSRTSLIMRLRL